MALSACQGNNKVVNGPDPNMYTLRLIPEVVTMEVGSTTIVSMFASETGVADITIHNVDWAVDNQTIATLTDSALSNGIPSYATIVVTCQSAGHTTLAGAVILGYEQRLTQSIGVTCTTPPPTPTHP
jgi:thiamine pyrophosphokinase